MPSKVFGRERVHHAAVAATVQVLNSQLLCAQFVSTLFRVGTSLWYVEAKTLRCRLGAFVKPVWPQRADTSAARDQR